MICSLKIFIEVFLMNVLDITRDKVYNRSTHLGQKSQTKKFYSSGVDLNIILFMLSLRFDYDLRDLQTKSNNIR